MTLTLRQRLGLLLAVSLVFFTGLGSPWLFDEDEPKNAECGREMYVRGDWLVPTFNEDLRTDKPILIYWLMLSSFHLFGVSELTARLHSSILSVGSVLLVWQLGRSLFRSEAGLLAGLILGTSLMFAAVGRSVTPDATLVFCILLSITAYVTAVARRHGGRFGQPDCEGTTVEVRLWSEYVPQTRLGFAVIYAAMGLAVLAKGPIGFLLPTAIWGQFLLLQRHRDRTERGNSVVNPAQHWLSRTFLTIWDIYHPRAFWAALREMRFPMGLLIIALVALPWYVAVGYATNGAWLAGFLGGHNVDRFLRPMENHSGPIIYYIPVIALGFFPWSIFLPASVWQVVRRIRPEGTERAAVTFVATWAVVWIGFFSLASTKLPNYVLPSYPALALLVASYLSDWITEAPHVRSLGFRHACRTLATIGIIAIPALLYATSIYLPGEAWLAGLGLIPLVGGILAFSAAQRAARHRAVAIYCGTALLLALGMMGVAAPRISRYQDSPQLAKLIRLESGGRPVRIGTHNYSAPNVVFYAAQRIDRLDQPKDITRFFNESPEGYLITRADRLEAITEALPQDVTILHRMPRFLRKHDLIVLGNQSKAESMTAAAKDFDRLRWK